MEEFERDQVYFRLREKSDRDLLKEIAKKENRNVSNMVETIVLDYLKYKNV